MRHEKKRVIKIIDEIITFLYSIGATDINLKIKDEKDKVILEFDSDYKRECREKLDFFVHILRNSEKHQELEEYYWELVGESDVDTEISIIRMMVDDIKIDIDDDFVNLIFTRKKNR